MVLTVQHHCPLVVVKLTFCVIFQQVVNRFMGDFRLDCVCSIYFKTETPLLHVLLPTLKTSNTWLFRTFIYINPTADYPCECVAAVSRDYLNDQIPKLLVCMNPLQIQMRKYDNCNVFFLGNSLKALLIWWTDMAEYSQRVFQCLEQYNTEWIIWLISYFRFRFLQIRWPSLPIYDICCRSLPDTPVWCSRWRLQVRTISTGRCHYRMFCY